MVLAVVAAACGGDGDSPAPTQPVEVQSVSLSEYVATVLQLELASFALSASPPTTTTEMAAYNWVIAGQYREAGEVLARLQPPPEAAAHAVQYQTLATDADRIFSAVAEAWVSGSGTDELQEDLSQITEQSAASGLELQALIRVALEQTNNALSLYMLESIDLRQQFAMLYSEAITGLQGILASEDSEAIGSVLREGSGEFLGFLEPWDALEPPTDADEAHRMQRNLFTSISQIFSDLIEPASASDQEGVQAIVGRMAAFNADVATANVAWNQLLIGTLAAAD